jgi:hypothetical protein
MSKFSRIRVQILASLTALASLAGAGTGCTHFANVTQADSPDGIPTYVSSSAYTNGSTKTVIVERVLETGGSCDLLEIQSHHFAPDGLLSQRSKELTRCGVVEQSTIDDFDSATGKHVRVERIDANHDGQFDHEQVVEQPVSLAELSRLSQVTL